MKLLTITKRQLTIKSICEETNDFSLYEKHYDTAVTQCFECSREFEAGEKVAEHTANNETFCLDCE